MISVRVLGTAHCLTLHPYGMPVPVLNQLQTPAVHRYAMHVQRHLLPYSPSPYVALALRLHRLVTTEMIPWAFFKLVDKASYRLGLWLQFLFSRMRYLYLTRIVGASGGLQLSCLDVN